MFPRPDNVTGDVARRAVSIREAMLQGIADQLGRGSEVHFFENILLMRARRFHADPEFIRDYRYSLALDQ